MSRGLFVIGTDTDVGKTAVCACLCLMLKNAGGLTAYFKPAASGVVFDSGVQVSSDMCFVKSVAQLNNESVSNSYAFETAVSPHLASKIEKNEINPEVIISEYRELSSNNDFIIVEGCGGLAVPLTSSLYMQHELINDLRINCILVCRAGLGTINHTLLTIEYAASKGIKILGIIVNNYSQSQLHDDNIQTIEKLSGIPVLYKVPDIINISENDFIDKLTEVFIYFDETKILDAMNEF